MHCASSSSTVSEDATSPVSITLSLTLVPTLLSACSKSSLPSNHWNNLNCSKGHNETWQFPLARKMQRRTHTHTHARHLHQHVGTCVHAKHTHAHAQHAHITHVCTCTKAYKVKSHQCREERARVRECSALKLKHTYTHQKHSRLNVLSMCLEYSTHNKAITHTHTRMCVHHCWNVTSTLNGV